MYILPWSLPQTTADEPSAKTPSLMHLFFVRIGKLCDGDERGR